MASNDRSLKAFNQFVVFTLFLYLSKLGISTDNFNNETVDVLSNNDVYGYPGAYEFAFSHENYILLAEVIIEWYGIK